MASRGYAVLDVQNDDDELQFQDFGLGSSSNSQTHTFTDFPDSPGHQADTDKLLGDYQDGDVNNKDADKDLSFWSFEFYQKFFDVDSKKVGDRILWSMVPKPGVNYLQVHLRPKPDLYGPFWVCLTLVFAAAITGNISNYLQTQGDQTVAWRYDFHKVSLAAFMVFSYGWLVPLILWAVLRYRSSVPPLNLLEFICLYGYSLSVLVPVCVVWTVPMVWLRWCVGIVGVVLSGAVLSQSVWEGLKGKDDEVLEEDEAASAARGSMKKVAMIILLVVIVMHIAIAMGFMFYFFREPLHPHGIRGAPLPIPTSLPAGNVPPVTLPPAAQKENAVSPTKREAVEDSQVNNKVTEPPLPAVKSSGIAKEAVKSSGIAKEAVKSSGIAKDAVKTSSKVKEAVKSKNETTVTTAAPPPTVVPVNKAPSNDSSSYKIKVLPKTAQTT